MSTMARVLSLVGVDLPVDLMVSNADNPAGLWESRAISAFNEALLVSRGSGWDDTLVRNHIGKFDEADVYQAYQLLEANYAGDRPIVLKDPRISKLTDLWDAAARSARYWPKYIVLVRDPWEVAASFSECNGFSMGKGLFLWAGYMLAVEKTTRTAERLFISYDDFISGPIATLDRIAASFGTAFPRRRGAEARVSAYVQNSQRQKRQVPRGNQLIGAGIDDFFQSLLTACRGEPLAAAPGERLETWLADFTSLFS
jgi:hypothetical protein